jgi:hypothetical protein
MNKMDLLVQEHLAVLMIGIDVFSAGFTVYVAAMITDKWGFRNRTEFVKFCHLVGLVVLAAAFAWHAKDIAVQPDAHGLAGSNFLKNVAVIYCLAFAAYRHHARQKRVNLQNKAYRNGDALTGPMGR